MPMELPVQRKNQKKYTRHNDSKPDKNKRIVFLSKRKLSGFPSITRIFSVP